MKVLRKIKMKALRKIALLNFNASKITDVDIVMKQNLPLLASLFHGKVRAEAILK